MIPVLAAAIRLVKKIIAIVHLPRVTIRLEAATRGAFFLERFTRPHHRYLLISQKTWGVALLNLPPTVSTYLGGKHRQALRTNRNRCLKQGYCVRLFDPFGHRAELDAIHLSMPRRQGKKMEYSRERDMQQAEDFRSAYLGVFAPGGELTACACTPVCGQSAVQLSFIGHHDHLQHGIMYALQVAVVEAAIAHGAQWLTYEGYFGQSEGMRYFLERCGYAPANVTWHISKGG